MRAQVILGTPSFIFVKELFETELTTVSRNTGNNGSTTKFCTTSDGNVALRHRFRDEDHDEISEENLMRTSYSNCNHSSSEDEDKSDDFANLENIPLSKRIKTASADAVLSSRCQGSQQSLASYTGLFVTKKQAVYSMPCFISRRMTESWTRQKSPQNLGLANHIILSLARPYFGILVFRHQCHD